MAHELDTRDAPGSGDSEFVDSVFADNLRLARMAAPNSPDLLVPPTANTLFVPTAPFWTQTSMKLPVGRQRMEVLNVSDYDGVEEALRARAASGPCSKAFELVPLRAPPRRFGLGHVNNGGPWMLDEPALADSPGRSWDVQLDGDEAPVAEWSPCATRCKRNADADAETLDVRYLRQRSAFPEDGPDHGRLREPGAGVPRMDAGLQRIRFAGRP